VIQYGIETARSNFAVTDKSAESFKRAIGIEITVTRYGTRYWTVYLNAELLAVTVYEKGALAVQAALTRPPS